MKSLLKQKINGSSFTIKEIAEFCGKSPQTFNNYLNGDQSPTIKTLELIGEKLGCKSIELVDPPEGFDHVYTSQGVWMGLQRIFN
jgi:transcriptional regulator with XRE-family HTH domain